MSNKTEVFRVAMAIARGSRIDREFLTPAEMREVFHALVAAVGTDAAFAELALLDGREALIRFPKLSEEFISIKAGGALHAAEFSFLPDEGSEVWGIDPESFLSLLRKDLQRFWWLPTVTTGLAAAALVTGQGAAFVGQIGQALVVASSLFFAVFVIFGIGQVVRPDVSDALFRSGSLQEGLDADRYCVRLAVFGFVTAFAALAWGVIGSAVGQAVAPRTASLVADIPSLVLLAVSGTAVLLSVLATIGYLLDRSADLTLKQSALQSFEHMDFKRRAAESTKDPEAAAARERETRQ